MDACVTAQPLYAPCRFPLDLLSSFFKNLCPLTPDRLLCEAAALPAGVHVVTATEKSMRSLHVSGDFRDSATAAQTLHAEAPGGGGADVVHAAGELARVRETMEASLRACERHSLLSPGAAAPPALTASSALLPTVQPATVAGAAAVLTVGEEASARDAAGACVQQLRAIVEAAPGVRAVAVMLHRAGHASVHVDVYAAPDGGPRRMA